MSGSKLRGRWLPLLLAVCACAPDPALEGPVARVDGVEIPHARLASAVERRVEIEPDRPRSDLLLEELDRLITEQVALNRADALGVQVHDAEVDERIRVLFGGETEGNTPEFTAEVHRQMRIDRTTLLELAKRLHVSQDAIADYFEQHRESFDSPPKVVIRHILFQDAQRAREIAAELRDGADFEELARRESIAPEAENGGLLPAFALGEMPEVFDRAFELPSGALSEAIESPFGFHLFRVEERVAASKASLDGVAEEVRQILEQRRLEELRNEWLRQLRREAKITVHERALDSLR
ncbi:MAG: peptidyl-prolyl cis-trans isomerase [Myxococcota bacterium]|nr:peptidyl-prolyl cis-trans isomerase [Myxococcota bacterium]